MSDENTESASTASTPVVTIAEYMNEIRTRYETKIAHYNESFDVYGTVDQNDLTKEVVRNVSGYHRCMTFLMEERMLLNKITDKKNEIHAKRYEHFRFNYNMKLDTRTDIEQWILKDDQYRRISLYYEYQKTLCEHLDNILKALDKRGWSIRNLTDLKKIEVGLS